MKVALRDSYVEYVLFAGVTEKYPPWFEEELYDTILIDDSRYTFWLHHNERTMEYYEKQLVEDYSVFLRKSNGEIHLTDYDVFGDMYMAFTYNEFTHSGIAALHEDCIEYVEAKAGVLPAGYPLWFYEYFTEAFNYPQDTKTFFFYDTDQHVLKASRGSMEVTAGGDVTITEHCVFLRNKYGEIRGMTYREFLKYYDDDPEIGGY
jgi:hypothetical protein